MARPDFIKLWGGSRPSIPAIGSVDYAGGWLAYLGTTPPSTDDHDYVMNLQDQRAIWLGEQALLSVGHEWQPDVSYDEDAYVRPVGGGPLYKSLNAVNLNNEPTASPLFWDEVAIGDVVDASTTVKGIVELATDTETQTGTDAVRAVTPAGMASVTATETRRGLVELATTAEAIAGSDASRAVTPAGAAAREAGKRYTSPQQLMPQGGTITLSHGLGVVPFSVVLEMVCVTTEHGYSPGDIIQLEWACTDFNVASRQGYGATVIKSSTQVRVYLANDYSFVAVSTGGAPAVLTPANWRLVVRAQA